MFLLKAGNQLRQKKSFIHKGCPCVYIKNVCPKLQLLFGKTHGFTHLPCLKLACKHFFARWVNTLTDKSHWKSCP